MVYNFIYSRRRSTPAEEKDLFLTEEEIKTNFDTLVETQADILHERNMKLQDAVVEILVEGKSRTDESMLTGRTEENKVVNFPGSEDCIGKIVKVKITKAATWSLTGEIINE